ncbi:MAG: hypothetical protein SPJ16_03670 [Helicobacter sp.]|uniref:hypothetical protein n=1 Tax=Helicobacter sp. TaxID=218 RepID=UPI002A90AFB4|nr:hypothetical protein [Helicobacter sp.]MDY5950276.1 hypothetical protein [Helicobacter sp.]
MKKLLIIVFGLQCVLFCIDLQEIENRKFYEVSIFSEENNILAKDSIIKNGSLAIYVFFTSNLVFEPNYFIINTKEKVLEKAHFADGDAHSKINIKQNEFKKVGDTLILANYMKFKWKDKSKGLLEVEEMDTISQKKTLCGYAILH